jgi:hypothetical protein
LVPARNTLSAPSASQEKLVTVRLFIERVTVGIESTFLRFKPFGQQKVRPSLCHLFDAAPSTASVLRKIQV